MKNFHLGIPSLSALEKVALGKRKVDLGKPVRRLSKLSKPEIVRLGLGIWQHRSGEVKIFMIYLSR